MHKIIIPLVMILIYTAAASADDVQQIELVAESYRFVPDHIVVEAGEPVSLVIVKKGMTPHDFIIDDPASGLSIKERLSGTTEIRFTPERTGIFTFYCGKKLPFMASHRDKGMQGTLEVR